jgi:hypothetical protein
MSQKKNIAYTPDEKQYPRWEDGKKKVKKKNQNPS